MASRDEKIPRSLERLWKRTGPRRRGPQPTLTRERIVAAAIEIADRDGLSALSMARLATRLGCAPMSLYRHVENKDELQVFMMDMAPGAPPAAASHAKDWRAGLERWARALREVYYRHPWILQIATGRPPLEPGQLAWLDIGLQTLAGTRLEPAEKLSVILLVLHYVRGEAQLATGVLQPKGWTGEQAREMQAWYARMLDTLVEPARFPALAKVMAAGAFAPAATGQAEGGGVDFDFGLERLLDGVAAAVAKRVGQRGGA